MSHKVMQVKKFNQLIWSKPKPITHGWHYAFVIPGRDRLREKGWVAYIEEDSIIEYARWYPNKKQALEAKIGV
jgi:hypothetical protein